MTQKWAQFSIEFQTKRVLPETALNSHSLIHKIQAILLFFTQKKLLDLAAAKLIFTEFVYFGLRQRCFTTEPKPLSFREIMLIISRNLQRKFKTKLLNHHSFERKKFSNEDGGMDSDHKMDFKY